MSSGWIHQPVIFFGKRIYILFAAAMSIPVWLACSAFINGMAVHDEEAVATAVTMCFFAGVFAGRYLAEVWGQRLPFSPSQVVLSLSVFIICSTCWLFIHADFPLEERALNLMLYWLPFIAMSLAIGILIKTVRTMAEKELIAARSEAAHNESELKLLQSQLSPHFLFNTLNNIYGISLKQHEKIPSLLLRLSDLLRYSVYEAGETYVSLSNEINYINNYIEFEKIRLGERLKLEVGIEDSAVKELYIAPMLLIVFVENAFKHSRNTADEKIFVSISLKIWNDLLLFSVRNSHGRQEIQFDRSSGLGLNNIRKRLELLYPDAYRLDIEEDDRMYNVSLQLKMKKNK